MYIRSEFEFYENMITETLHEPIRRHIYLGAVSCVICNVAHIFTCLFLAMRYGQETLDLEPSDPGRRVSFSTSSENEYEYQTMPVSSPENGFKCKCPCACKCYCDWLSFAVISQSIGWFFACFFFIHTFVLMSNPIFDMNTPLDLMTYIDFVCCPPFFFVWLFYYCCYGHPLRNSGRSSRQTIVMRNNSTQTDDYIPEFQDVDIRTELD